MIDDPAEAGPYAGSRLQAGHRGPYPMRINVRQVGGLCAAVIIAAVPLGVHGHAASRASSRNARAGAAPAVMPAADQRSVLDKYCVTCHNERLKTAELLLDKVDPADVAAAPQIWEKVARKLRAGVMPPGGRPRPEKSSYDGLVSSLEAALDRAVA